MEENIFQPLEEYYNRLKNQDYEVENAIKLHIPEHVRSARDIEIV